MLQIMSLLVCAVSSVAAAYDPRPEPGPITLPVNRWTKVADCPADPLGRELQPGRGAFWCYEPVSQRFVRYGGYTPTDDNSLWTFDLAARTWANPLEVDYTWPPPADRPGAGAWWSMAYDTKRNVIWLSGGSGLVGRTHGDLMSDIWQYHPADGTFKAMKSKGFPAFSDGCRIVYDSKNDLVIRAPGYDGEWAALHNRDRTWVYDPNKNAWTGRSTPGSPKSAPGGIWVFDVAAGKTVFGALSGDGGPTPTWTYDAARDTWDRLVTETAPPARVYCGATYDRHHQRVVVYGGVGRGSQGYAHRGGGPTLNDTWVLDTARRQWTRLDTQPVIPTLPGNSQGRFVLPVAMDYDARHRAVVVSAPTFGVWALRYQPLGAEALPDLTLAALPEVPRPQPTDEPIFRQAPPNPTLVNLAPNQWVRLGGGPAVGGGEVPMTYDEATGFALRYGGCNDGGTTFASGYGNDLTAYDPATERWLALRWTDPCAPPRPHNGCTRFYAYDPVRKVTWFASGTAGNRLAASLPLASKGDGGTWSYDGLRDRFELVPSTGRGPAIGVVCAYDRANHLFICSAKQQWGTTGVFLFDPAQKTWTQKGTQLADAYTYGCYVDSLKGLMVIDPQRGGLRTMLYDAASGAWRDLAPKPDLPAGLSGRPTLAYDRDQDIVLGLFGGRTCVYQVKENAWSPVTTNAPGKASECLVYDTRHQVFLATHNMGEHMWAFRYAAQPAPAPAGTGPLTPHADNE